MFSIGVSNVISRVRLQSAAGFVSPSFCPHTGRVVAVLGEIITFCRITNKTLDDISLSICEDVYPQCWDVVVRFLGVLNTSGHAGVNNMTVNNMTANNMTVNNKTGRP